MDDSEFDKAMVGAALALAARKGWARMSVAEAASDAALPLGRARARFPARLAVAMRLGLLADQAALSDSGRDGSVRDRLFDLIMRRIDTFQNNRAGVLALLDYLPSDPGLAALLLLATRRSLRWLMEAAGVQTTTVRGEIALRGLVGVWLWTFRAWRADDTEDLSTTMAALDKALGRAEQAAGWLYGAGGTAAGAAESLEAPPADPDLPPGTMDLPPEPPPGPAVL